MIWKTSADVFSKIDFLFHFSLTINSKNFKLLIPDVGGLYLNSFGRVRRFETISKIAAKGKDGQNPSCKS